MHRNIKALTGIRGLAACYVAFYHIHGTSSDEHSIVGPFIHHGYIAVDFFFVLSGYVMALSYGHMFETPTPRRFSVFMARRAARIYPLYFTITCIVMVAVQLGFSSRPSFPPPPLAFGLNLLLVQNWGLSYSIVVASWSISTELAAYILFPLLLAVAVQGRPLLAWLTAAASIGVLSIVAFQHYDISNNGPLDVFFDYSPWPLVRCLAEFTVGLLAFRLTTELRYRLSPARPWLGASPILLAILAALLFVPRSDLALVIVFAGLTVLLGLNEMPVRSLLATPTVLLLGELSFAVYLLHWEFLRIVQIKSYLAPGLGMTGAKIAADLVYFTCLLATAWLCYTYIEKPGRRLIRHWARNLELAPASAAS